MSSTFRSTKGASKQRRDLINTEILNLRDLLPLPEAARQRLSQLQIMSLANVYIRKCNYFGKMFQNGNGGSLPGSLPTDNNFEFPQTLTGFVLVTTREGKLLYISENVTEYLGHSMVDMMTQGDSLYDIIDKRDHTTVQSNLLSNVTDTSDDVTPTAERTFFCRMSVARSFRRQAGFGEHKMMHVRGHFIQPSVRDHYGSQPVFMAMCSPLITPEVKESLGQHNTMTFQTVHGLDMKTLEVAPNGEHHLGYTESEMFGRSWYEMLHPADIHEAKEKHVQLIKSSHEMGCMLTVRLQTKAGGWVWVNIVMHIRQPFVCDNGDPAIVCINHVINEKEAELFKMQSQLYSSHIAPSPEFMGPPQGSSPSHTITQVPAPSPERYTVTGSFITLPAGGEERNYYTGEEVTSGQDEMVRVVTGLAGGSSNSSRSASSSPELPEPEKQQSVRANVLNRLKRKVSETGGCRPGKRSRVSDHPGGVDGGAGVQYQANVLTGPAPGFLDELVSSVYSTAGDVQVVNAVHDAPVYSELAHIKKELEMPTPRAELPMSPLTPQSITSEGGYYGGESTFPGCTQLKVDVDTAVVPLSILTPDPSPVSSPMSVTAMSPAHQTIPSPPGYQSPPYQTDLGASLPTELFADLENKSFYHRELPKSRKPAPRAPAKPVISLAKQENLPELDWNCLEDLFSTVDMKTQQLRRRPQMSSRPLSALPVPVLEKDDARKMVPSPVLDLERQQHTPLAGNHSNLTTADESLLSQFSEDQLSRLVANVADTLLDLVSVKEEQQQQQSPARDDDLMDLASILSDDTFTLSPSHGDNVLSSTEEICHELHQLNELAASGPSYGNEELATQLFTETL